MAAAEARAAAAAMAVAVGSDEVVVAGSRVCQPVLPTGVDCGAQLIAELQVSASGWRGFSGLGQRRHD